MRTPRPKTRPNTRPNTRPKSGVSRVHFIEITVPTAWMVEGELWRFRHGTHLAVGGANDLDAAEPMVTAAVALGLINASKAEALDITDLENISDITISDIDDE